MKNALVLCIKLFTCLLLFLGLTFAYLHFGPRKMHFAISRRSKAHFNQAATSFGAGDVTFHTLAGDPRHLATYKGQVVILHRWGTWCAPCVAEMPAFQRFYDRYRSDPKVQFVVVASMNSPAEVTAFAARYHYDLPFYVADDRDDAGTNLSTFPRTTFYARDGTLSETMVGAVDWAGPSVLAQIETLRRF